MSANAPPASQLDETNELTSFVKGLGVDLVGIADLHSLKGMPLGIPV